MDSATDGLNNVFDIFFGDRKLGSESQFLSTDFGGTLWQPKYLGRTHIPSKKQLCHMIQSETANLSEDFFLRDSPRISSYLSKKI